MCFRWFLCNTQRHSCFFWLVRMQNTQNKQCFSVASVATLCETKDLSCDSMRNTRTPMLFHWNLCNTQQHHCFRIGFYATPSTTNAFAFFLFASTAKPIITNVAKNTTWPPAMQTAAFHNCKYLVWPSFTCPTLWRQAYTIEFSKQHK